MILLSLILLGLVLGSFVNAFVWRVRKKKDWIRDRSECTHCHHVLGPLDLVPVISWISLKGKCRYCGKKIEDSPLTELALPLLFAVSYLSWPYALHGVGLITFGFWLVFLLGFTILAVYDFRWYLLPNKIVFPLIILGIVQIMTVATYDHNWGVLYGAAMGALVVGGTFYLLFVLSNGTWIGGGDVKLGIVLGMLAGGVLEGFLVLFVASLGGMLAALPLIVQGKAHRKTQLPFGPFLMLGLIVVVLYGDALLGWYTGLLYA